MDHRLVDVFVDMAHYRRNGLVNVVVVSIVVAVPVKMPDGFVRMPVHVPFTMQ